MRSKSTVSEGRSLVETQRYGLQRRFRRFARRTNPTCNGSPATITVSSHGRSAKTSGFHGNALTEQTTMDDGAPLLLVVLHGTGRRVPDIFDSRMTTRGREGRGIFEGTNVSFFKPIFRKNLMSDNFC